MHSDECPPAVMTINVTAYNLPVDVITSLIASGKNPTGAQRKAISALFQMSNLMIRLAAWIGYGMKPWENFETTEKRYLSTDDGPEFHAVDDYGNA